MRRGWLALGSLALGFMAVSHWGCEVPPLMSPGSSITVFANPEFIAANGGVSVITALVVEPAGTLAPDGTVVFFFTNLGRVDSEGKTTNGVARVNFVSDSRSGEARIQAFSGGAAPAPSGSGAGSGTDSFVIVRVGSRLPTRVVLTANPPNVRGGGASSLTANVFDVDGNPVSGVAVIFSLSVPPSPAPPPGAQDTLDSGGAQQFTDNNGRAFDTLRTRPVVLTRQITVTVTVLATGSVTDSIVVSVNP